MIEIVLVVIAGELALVVYHLSLLTRRQRTTSSGKRVLWR